MPKRAPTTPPLPDERRTELLKAATQIFARYGYKKASMDDAARAAGLSRQGLYLHFPSKEALFREVVTFVLARSFGAGQAALSGKGDSIEERLVAAFDAVYGQKVGGLGATPHMAELLEAATQLVGDLVGEKERTFREAVVQTLTASGVTSRWAAAGLSAPDLAQVLDAVGCGLKHRVASRAEFVERFRKAARLICAPPGSERRKR